MNARRTVALVALVGWLAPAPGWASDPYRECADAVAAAPAALESYLCYRRTERRVGRPEEAALRLRGLLARDPRNDAARLALAGVQYDRGRDEAAELYRAAADAFAARGHADGEVRARLGLASALGFRGERDAVDAALDRAQAVAERAGDPFLRARAAISQAGRWYRNGDYGRAVREMAAVEAVLFPGGPADLRGPWLVNMGTFLWASHGAEEAARHWRRALDVVREEGDRFYEALVLGNLLVVAAERHAPITERRALALELVQSAAARGNRWAEGRAYDHLAAVSTGPERIAYARRGLAIAREANKVSEVVEGLRALGTYLATEDPAEAFRLHDEADRLTKGLGSPAAVAWNTSARADTRWITGPRARAIADSLAALQAVEAVRNLQPDTEVRARSFSRWSLPYTRLVGRILAGHLRAGQEPSPDELALAFDVMERRRSRVLLDEMDAARATAALVPWGPAAARRAAVLGAVSSVQRRLLSPALGPGQRQQALSELERLEREEAGLRDELSRTADAFASLRPSRFASVAEIQQALDPDEALVAFQLAAPADPGDPDSFAGGSWAFALTRSGAHAAPVGEGALAAAPLFLGLFERRDGSEAPAAVRLYRDLLEPSLAVLPPSIRRLVVVPDGIVHRLPLDALRPAAREEPLGARYEISLTPSATVWLRLRREAPLRAPAPALALADPDVASAGAEPMAERASALAVGARLGRLPHARTEARSLVRELGGESRALTGAEATEAFVKKTDLTRYGILHVAAHALVDDEKPERSAILLAPGAAEEDGLLQIRELVRLGLKGKVVVLSACRSASGQVLAGEGVMGLARALFQAGARTVVGSLWPLRDDDAERLFRGFYRHLADGRSVAGSLAAARRDAIGAGLPAGAWASLVVLGDGGVVPVPSRPQSAWPRSRLAALAAFIVLMALLIGRARPRSA